MIGRDTNPAPRSRDKTIAGGASTRVPVGSRSGSDSMTYRIQSSDIIRLMQHHLLECGLPESAAALQRESGVGLTASPVSLQTLATSGRWGDVLISLSRLDESARSFIPPSLLVEVREMAVLELAASGDVDLARLTMRNSGDSLRDSADRRALLDKALSFASAAASAQQQGGVGKLPDDFFGLGTSRQARRDRVGKSLEKYVPPAPANRLVTLLNQALRWEQHTGTLPSTNPADYVDVSSAVITDFDIVVGKPPPHLVGDGISSDHSTSSDKCPTQQFGVIKFGKSSHPEAAVFLPDGSSLVTASADGFVEVYDHLTCKLRTADLPYQANSEFMVHDSSVLSLAHSPDGELLASGTSNGDVCVWGVASGRCLRKFSKAHPVGVLCLAFSQDGSKVLTGSLDHLSREFGLRAGKLLQEYRGHSASVQAVDASCGEGARAVVLTGSADATVRVWRPSTGECVRVVSLPGSGGVGASVAGPPIVAVLTFEEQGRGGGGGLTPDLIVVPRGPVAYVVSGETGAITRTFRSLKDTGADFVAACLSPKEKYLYAVTEERLMYCFDVATGQLDRTVEIGDYDCIGICSHPQKNIVATFANEGSRGKVKLWTP